MKISGRVFLSHSSKDKDFVRDFDTALQAFGIETFLDERDIGIGEDIPQRLYQELSHASHIIYFISRNSIDSKWVQEELSIGKVREKEKKGVQGGSCDNELLGSRQIGHTICNEGDTSRDVKAHCGRDQEDQ